MTQPQEVLERASRIQLLLTDCDGVLTDNGVYYSDSGEALKRFSIRDGMGVERLRKLCGIETGIITGEISPSVRERAAKLRITELHLGIKDKPAVIQEISERTGISFGEMAYIGDDTNDVEVLGMVGLACCPSDAMRFAQEVSHYISTEQGGHGAFRDVAELIIHSQTETWQK
jgi:3-deoxy-D-manno-octulosonate 8-phosphate phosphatase (KDO 8-P phosphatase)